MAAVPFGWGVSAGTNCPVHDGACGGVAKVVAALCFGPVEVSGAELVGFRHVHRGALQKSGLGAC